MLNVLLGAHIKIHMSSKFMDKRKELLVNKVR